jgi:hypothetical protein
VVTLSVVLLVKLSVELCGECDVIDPNEARDAPTPDSGERSLRA